MDLLRERTQHPAWGVVGARAQWGVCGTPEVGALWSPEAFGLDMEGKAGLR